MKRKTHRELVVCGYNAVAAALETHPERVKRLFFNARLGRSMGRYARELAARKKIYRQVEDDELQRISGTLHHGGVAAVTEVPPLREPDRAEVIRWAAAGEPLLLLDQVGNSHNLGALARTAAFFGLPRLVLAGGEDQAAPNAAAYRVAEGGLEHVECFQVPDLAHFCHQIGLRYRVIGTALKQAETLPSPDVFRSWQEPVALVMGNEETGISRPVLQNCRSIYRIPGSGKMESLNVSAAGAVLMYHFFSD